MARVLGYWTFGQEVPALDVLWSNASGSLLIGVIPGNEFTPVPLPAAASAAFESGAW